MEHCYYLQVKQIRSDRRREPLDHKVHSSGESVILACLSTVGYKAFSIVLQLIKKPLHKTVNVVQQFQCLQNCQSSVVLFDVDKLSLELIHYCCSYLTQGLWVMQNHFLLEVGSKVNFWEIY